MCPMLEELHFIGSFPRGKTGTNMLKVYFYAKKIENSG
jgi:hypothetical protein